MTAICKAHDIADALEVAGLAGACSLQLLGEIRGIGAPEAFGDRTCGLPRFVHRLATF